MIDKLLSQRVQGLESYKPSPSVQGMALDKNEMPWSLDGKVKEMLVEKIKNVDFNRYPDSGCTALKKSISRYTGIDTGSIAVGNGSDELISLLVQTFINPDDIIAVHNPTFSMYKAYGAVCGARISEYDLEENFEMELEEYFNCLNREKPKLVFLCNPNNPTGSCMELKDIERLLEYKEGMVVVDEAYFEFSGITAAGLLSNYDHLIILRTFSKAFGLAGLRVGYMLGSPKVIGYIDRVRSPYNVNSLAQAAAEAALDSIDMVNERVAIVINERDKLYKLLSDIEDITCYRSMSNFIMIRSIHAGKIFRRLQEAGICIRNFSGDRLKDCLRITVGSPEDNMELYKVIKEVCEDV